MGTARIATTARSLRLRSGKSERSICHWQIDQAVLRFQFFEVGLGIVTGWIGLYAPQPRHGGGAHRPFNSADSLISTGPPASRAR